jgi:hypothetical protein
MRRIVLATLLSHMITAVYTEWYTEGYTENNRTNIKLILSSFFYIQYTYSLSSSAQYSPLLDIGLSNFSSSCSISGYSHPPPASRPAQIVTAPGLKTSYTTFTETRSPLQNSFITLYFFFIHQIWVLPFESKNKINWIIFKCSQHLNKSTKISLPLDRTLHNGFPIFVYFLFFVFALIFFLKVKPSIMLPRRNPFC